MVVKTVFDLEHIQVTPSSPHSEGWVCKRDELVSYHPWMTLLLEDPHLRISVASTLAATALKFHHSTTGAEPDPYVEGGYMWNRHAILRDSQDDAYIFLIHSGFPQPLLAALLVLAKFEEPDEWGTSHYSFVGEAP